MRRLFIAIVALLSVLIGPGLASAYPMRPADRFLTLRTPHFRVTYPSEYRFTALKTAVIAEEVLPELSRQLKWEPRDIIDLVLTDYTDSANGSSSVTPIPVVNLFMAPPFADDRLDYCDDWLRLLITHELAHSVNLDQVRALPAVGRAVFGRITQINQLQPVAFVEGTAVHEETLLTTRGRGRSPVTLMMLRAAALENRWPTLDQISSNSTQWPGGAGPYLWGGMFLHFLSQRYGDTALGFFHRKHAGQVWPFLFNHNAKRVFGHSMNWLYADWTKRMRQGFEQQKARIVAEGIQEGSRLTKTGYYHSRPRWLGPDRLLYEEYSGTRSPQIRQIVFTPAGVRDQILFITHGTMGTAIAANGDVYYSDSEPWDRWHSGLDIWRKSAGSSSRKRLTTLARATEPVILPGRPEILCITQKGGRTRLTTLRPDTGELVNLVEFANDADYVQFSSPAADPRGNRIALSVWHDDGNRDIFSFDLTTKAFRRLTFDHEQDLDPSFSSDGRFLFFSSARTGIYNIYALDQVTGHLFQVTNVLGGAFAPAMDPTGTRLAYIGYNGSGYDVYWIPVDQATWREVERETIGEEALVVGPISKRINQLAREADYPTEDYAAWRTVWPHWWLPDFAFGSDSFYLGLQTSGADPLHYHNWDFAGQYNFRRQFVIASADYTYAALTPLLHVGASRSVENHGTIAEDDQGNPTDYWEERWQGQFDVMWPLYARHFLIGGYLGEWRDMLESLSDASDEEPYTGYWSGLRFGWTYSNARSYTQSIDNIDGLSATVSTTFYDPVFGSKFRQQIAAGQFASFIPLPLRNHSLVFRLNTGISFGDLLPQRTFLLGGFSTSNVFDPVVNSDRWALRGYGSGFNSGDRGGTGSVEWPFPLFRINRGISTWPVFLQTINLAPFYDVGFVLDRDEALETKDLFDSVGATFSLDMVFVYHYSFRLMTVLAYGLRETDGVGGFHWLLSTGIPYL